MSPYYLAPFAILTLWVLLRLIGYLIRGLGHPILTLYEALIFLGDALRIAFGLTFAMIVLAHLNGRTQPWWYFAGIAAAGGIWHLIKTTIIDPTLFGFLEHGGAVNYFRARAAVRQNNT